MFIVYPPALKYQLYRSVHNYSIVVISSCSHICKAGVDVVFTLTLQYHPPDVSYTFNYKWDDFQHLLNFVIIFCLTRQEVCAPVYIRGAEGRHSDDLSRFWIKSPD